MVLIELAFAAEQWQSFSMPHSSAGGQTTLCTSLVLGVHLPVLSGYTAFSRRQPLHSTMH